MFSAMLQDFNILTILPASLVICCALLFVRKSNCKKCVSYKSREKCIFANEFDPLVDFTRIGQTFHETSIPEENNQSCLNLAKVNYLNLLNNTELRNGAESSIRKYGVGSCGPRGFYGTIDIHLALETRLAQFMGLEEAVLYSYGFSTISSAISAYCKKSDIIFCDEEVGFSAAQGMLAAKSKIVYFKHNDTVDLELKLKQYEKREKQTNKLFRKFLVVEAIYQATGTLCPLPKLMELREKYKLRIFIDESISFGVLGSHGRGITEHFNINRCDVDMIMASMEGAIGSIAGFCVGSSFIIDHQRLSGIGYVYSASLPPFLSHMSICVLDLFENDASLFTKLQSVSIEVDQALKHIDQCLVVSDPLSPLKVITLRNEENRIENIKNIHVKCIERNILVVLVEDRIHFHVNTALEQCDINRIITTLKDAFRECNNKI